MKALALSSIASMSDDYDDLLWSSRKAQTTERRDTAVTPVRK